MPTRRCGGDGQIIAPGHRGGTRPPVSARRADPLDAGIVLVLRQCIADFNAKSLPLLFAAAELADFFAEAAQTRWKVGKSSSLTAFSLHRDKIIDAALSGAPMAGASIVAYQLFVSQRNNVSRPIRINEIAGGAISSRRRRASRAACVHRHQARVGTM